MKAFTCLLLLPLLASSLEIVPLTKREFDHRSNIELLNNLSYETSKPADISPISSPTPSIENLTEGTIPVTINTESLALGNPNPIQNVPQFTYASSFPQNLPLINNPQLDNNIIYITGDRPQSPAISFANGLPPINPGLSLVPAPNANYPNGATNIEDNRNILQTYVPQNMEIPQPYPFQVIREVKVPQPYPVHITRTVQVPVHVRVPVEVPKPYAVKVPHPVPVPVHIRVPVPVDRPYPVQITKTVAVPVEKPVYIKVPQPIQVPVPQPYPVAVPQPVQVQVPFIVRLPEVSQDAQSFVAGQAVPNPEGIPVPGVPDSEGVPPPKVPNLETVPKPVVPSFGNSPVSLQASISLPGIPALADLQPVTETTTECSTCKDTGSDPTTLAPSPKPRLSPITGNGLLPPHPPRSLSSTQKPDKGLLSSYVSSKEGGVYRRGTEYQTKEYKKTW